MATLWKLSMLRHVKDYVDGEVQVSHVPLVPPRSAYMGGRECMPPFLLRLSGNKES